MITKENYKYFNLSAIEQVCNIPRGVLLQSIKEIRKLPAKHEASLRAFLSSLITETHETTTKEKETIKAPEKTVKTRVIKETKEKPDNYQLLFSGKYRNRETGEIITKDEYLTRTKKAT